MMIERKPMQTHTPPRSDKLDLRLSVGAKKMLRDAARRSNKSMSEFVLESALARAEETLADRQLFTLDAKQWALFNKALDAPSQDSPSQDLPRLKKLFQDKSVFESA